MDVNGRGVVVQCGTTRPTSMILLGKTAGVVSDTVYGAATSDWLFN